MPEKIFEAKGQPIASGQHPGLPNQNIPLWRLGSNVLTEDQSVKPASGQGLLYTKIDSDRITGLLATYGPVGPVTVPVQEPAEPGAVWGTETSLFLGQTSANPVDVTRLSGAYAGTQLWSIVQFGAGIFATNGTDPIQYLAPGASNFVDLDTVSDLDPTFICRLLAVNGSYLVAWATDNDPAEIRWSSEDDPFTWVPLVTNSARDIQVRDLGSEIISVVDFTEGLAFFGSTQAHIFAFIGAPFFFGENHLIEGIGACSKHSVVPVGRALYGWGPDGIWKSDGAAFDYIDQPSVAAYLYEEIYDKDRCDEIVGWPDLNNSLIYWAFPDLTGRGQTVSFDFKRNVWNFHQQWRTAASNGGNWLNPITADHNGNVWAMGRQDQPISGEPQPLQLNDSGLFSTGYGEAGYGEWGYGGEQEVT